MENIIYVGADVHKDTNSVCMFDWNDGSFFAEAVIVSTTVHESH